MGGAVMFSGIVVCASVTIITLVMAIGEMIPKKKVQVKKVSVPPKPFSPMRW